MFFTYLKLDMDIDVIICYVEFVAIVLKFWTCELLDMNNGVNYDVKLVAIVLIFMSIHSFKKCPKRPNTLIIYRVMRWQDWIE